MRNLSVILLVLFSGSRMLHGNSVAGDGAGPDTFEASLPNPAVLMLFRWPDQAVLTGEKAVDPRSTRVAAQGKMARKWIEKVLDASSLPPENTELFFIREEFLNRDVIRAKWERDGYRFEVAQTASIFTLKVIPAEAAKTGEDQAQRFEFAKQMCRRIFNRKGRMWGLDAQGTGKPVPVLQLNEKIELFSFDGSNVRQTASDKVVIGRPSKMNDESIRPDARPQGVSDDGANEESRETWKYWFRNVNWWNDGNAVGFYFLKSDGPGSWIPSFVGEIDRNWFHEPRDRLGRPIPVQQE